MPERRTQRGGKERSRRPGQEQGGVEQRRGFSPYSTTSKPNSALARDVARKHAKGKPPITPRTRQGTGVPRGSGALVRPVKRTGTIRGKRRRRYRIKLRAKILMAFLLFLILFSFARCVGNHGENTGSVNTIEVNDQDRNPLDAKIISDSAILVDLQNKDVLYEKNADEQRYPASLTKMMTLYVAVKSNKDINRTVVVPNNAFADLQTENAAIAGLSPGEALPFKDLLYAMMLPSGADAAKSIAIITSGSESDFVHLMNRTAEKMKLEGSYFTNVTGLQDPKQVTTAKDMAKLLKKGLDNKTFHDVITSMSHVTAPTAQHPQGLALQHSLQKQGKAVKAIVGDKPFAIIGGKTGYTPEAGLCLASLGRATDGRQAIAVTLHARGDSDNYQPVIKDAAILYEEAFKKS